MDLPEQPADDHVPPPDYPPPPTTSREGRGYTVAAFVLAALALLFAPPILGGIGIALGVVGYRKGDALGRTAAIVAGVALVIGMGLSLAAHNAADDALGLVAR